MQKILALTLLSCCFSPMRSSAQVDGFSKGRGNMDLVGSLSYEQGFGYFLAEGTASVHRYRAALSVFAARGLTKDLDVQASIPFITSNGSSGLQDGQVFLKWLPVSATVGKGKLTFGAAIGGSVPLTKYQTEGLGAIGQQASSIVPLGVLQYTAANGYFASVVGGQSITEAPTPDALLGTLRFGHASSTHYWEAYLRAQEAYGGKDYRGVGELAPNTFKELGVSYLRVGGKYYKPVGTRFGYVGEVNYTLAGRNADHAVMAAFSFIAHFRK